MLTNLDPDSFRTIVITLARLCLSVNTYPCFLVVFCEPFRFKVLKRTVVYTRPYVINQLDDEVLIVQAHERQAEQLVAFP